MTIENQEYVLLVEDDEDLQIQMAYILENEGIRVVTVENGKVALDHLLSCNSARYPRCIILDLMMPVMTGEQFLKKILNDYAQDLGKIPVIVATAKGSTSIDLVGMPPHIERIRKPMEIEELIESVLKHCPNSIPEK